ncbi:MAG: hypothetical protein CMQ47_05180 [Gammaproteobacteria bacterium]|uniref:Uncharacterized protein n=1 Tax=marine metagenome TaxID=408172 RepID=A0A381W613_9ZZZZ|nr:hypothetical protein [Gammaproteobacteria bacterium]MED5556293.1 hypothetical protein [Pseudomonadota bacterium]
MSSDRILMILMTAVAILAVVPAVPGGEYAALILVGLGLISGFMNPEDDLLTRLVLIVVAVALPTIANSLDAIPVVGGFVNSILDNVAVAIAGIVVANVLLQIYARLMPADDSGSSAGGGGGYSSE